MLDLQILHFGQSKESEGGVTESMFIFSSFIGIIGGIAVASLIVGVNLFFTKQDKPTKYQYTEWLSGFNLLQNFTIGKPGNQLTISEYYEIGLRSDGAMVWRKKIEAKP